MADIALAPTGETPSALPRRHRRAKLALCVLGLGLILLVWYYAAAALVDRVSAGDADRFARRARDSADQIATNLARDLQDEVRRLANLPEVLAEEAVLRAPLQRTSRDDARRTAAMAQAANTRLRQVAVQLEVDIVYILDAQGRCVAASNYQNSDSVVGVDLHTRQYFVAIENGGRGRQFAFGGATGVPGVYFSSGVRVDGQFKGGIVVKRAIYGLFRLTSRNAVMLVDQYGVVVAGNSDAALWHYLPDSGAVGLGSDFIEARYHQSALMPIDLYADSVPGAVSLVHLFADPVPSLMTARPIGDSGLRLVYFTPLPDLGVIRHRAQIGFWLIFLSGCLVLSFLLGSVAAALQIRRRVALLRDSHQTLAVLSRQLAAQKDAAEAADRAKSRYLASMGHQLRTPLTGILGLVDLLRASPLPRAAMLRLDLLERSARSLLSLLNDMLDFSLIDQGQVRVARVPLDLGPIIDDLGELQRAVAAAKGISLTVNRPAGPLRGLGDPNRLRQILNQYLCNAIKFTVLGGVRMTVALDGEADCRQLRIVVSDSGPGMTMDVQQHLFEPFLPADAASTRYDGSGGLGLAIARRIAYSMGGDVGVESEAGHGATFWLQVPFPATDLAPVNRDLPIDPG